MKTHPHRLRNAHPFVSAVSAGAILSVLAITIATQAACTQTGPATIPAAPKAPIRVFILAGDECVLEEGVVDGDKPGTLATVVSKNREYAFLKDKAGAWVKRSDVVLYDAHAIHNNTEAPARPLQVGTLAQVPQLSS